MVDTFGTGKLDDEKIAKIVEKNFDFRPAAIIRDLDLRRPIYRKTAAYGHFGRQMLSYLGEKTRQGRCPKGRTIIELTTRLN